MNPGAEDVLFGGDSLGRLFGTFGASKEYRHAHVSWGMEFDR